MHKTHALLLAVLTLAGSQALAQSEFSVTLNSAQEVGTGSNSSATGFGSLTLNPDGTVTYNISYSGLVGDYTASHIHGNATAFPGANAGVLVGLNNTPTTTRSGVLQGTTAALTTQQAGFLTSGSTYVNIHSVAFGGGEIRGQIVAVPEPSTLALGVLGLGLVGACAGRRKSAV
jgi:hypothetical protein